MPPVVAVPSVVVPGAASPAPEQVPQQAPGRHAGPEAACATGSGSSLPRVGVASAAAGIVVTPTPSVVVRVGVVAGP